MNRRATVLFIVTILAWSLPVAADITATGDIDPAYGSADPWVVDGALTVGVTTDAGLVVSGGSDVNAADAFVAASAGSTATVQVSGDGSSWHTDRSLNVGQAGDGTMVVSDGATLDAWAVWVGAETGSVGDLTITGDGTTWQGQESWVINGGPAPAPDAPRDLNIQVTVAQNGTGNLTIADGARVIADEGILQIASWFDSTGTVTVTGPNSAWEQLGVARVGFLGDGTLVIADGGVMSTRYAEIGMPSYGASDGSVTVTDAGSLWQVGQGLYIGQQGLGELLVSSGGRVDSGYAWIDCDYAGVSDYSIATITGPGSLWQNADYLAVGYDGRGRMQIADGGHVTDVNAYIGYHEGADGLVTVSDVNSLWAHSGQLHVGYAGAGNLTVSDAGQVASEVGVIGTESTGYGFATVTGAGSLWQNGQYLSVGHGGEGYLRVEEGAQVTDVNAYLGYQTGSAGQVWVEDPNSLWATSGTLHVGYAGQGIVSVGTGGQMTSATAIIGTESTGDGMVDVSHTGSQWANTGNLEIGRGGTGGLLVDSGGEAATQNATLAVDPNSTAVLSVSGAGSVFEVQDTLNVGFGGEANVYVSGGGRIDSNDVFLAQEAGGTAMVSVADANSLWSAIDLFDVGVRGEAALTISNGGQVTASGTGVGVKPGSAGTVIVTGDGSLWQVAGGLTIGVAGQGALVVSDSGSVEANTIRVASEDSGPSSAMVTGAGSLLTAETIVVDDVGVLDVNDGGQVSSTEGHVSGAVQITGAGSTWTNSNDLAARNASIVVSNGGRLITGRSSILPGNGQTISIAVSGPGSLWDTGRLLFVTRDSHVGILVSDGGQITSDWVAIAETGAGMVDVTVTGAGSRWDAGGQLTIGSSGDDEIDTIVTVSDGGVVEVNNVTVWRGGALAGDGTFVVDGVANHGIIRPGNSIGTITFDGDLTMEPNSVLEVEVDNEGHSDKLIVTGAFMPGAGAIQTIPTEVLSSGGWHDYTIVEANDITWPLYAFDSVEDTAFLQCSIFPGSQEDPNVMRLRVVPLAFDDPHVAQTDNQRSFGAAVTQLALDPNNSLPLMLQRLETAPAARAAYDQLSGQTRAPLAHASLAAGTRPMETVAGRMRDASRASSSGGQASRLDGGAGRYSFAVGNGTPYLGAEQWGIWGKFYGLYGDRETDGAELGYQYSAYGGGFGMDYEVSENWLFGITGGYWDGDVTFASSADTTSVTSTYAGLYGSYETSRWYADGVLTYSNLSYESTRYVALVGEQLEGDFDGRMFGGYVEAGLNWWRRANCLIQPLASLQVASVDIDSYTESGGATSLRYESEQYTSTKSGLGLKATRQFLPHADGTQLEVELRGRWLHEFGDTQSDVAVQFADAPTVSFRVSDPELARDSALLGAGLRARLGEATRLFVDYDTELGSDRNVQMVSAGLEYRW